MPTTPPGPPTRAFFEGLLATRIGSSIIADPASLMSEQFTSGTLAATSVASGTVTAAEINARIDAARLAMRPSPRFRRDIPSGWAEEHDRMRGMVRLVSINGRRTPFVPLQDRDDLIASLPYERPARAPMVVPSDWSASVTFTAPMSPFFQTTQSFTRPPMPDTRNVRLPIIPGRRYRNARGETVTAEGYSADFLPKEVVKVRREQSGGTYLLYASSGSCYMEWQQGRSSDDLVCDLTDEHGNLLPVPAPKLRRDRMDSTASFPLLVGLYATEDQGNAKVGDLVGAVFASRESSRWALFDTRCGTRPLSYAEIGALHLGYGQNTFADLSRAAGQVYYARTYSFSAEARVLPLSDAYRLRLLSMGRGGQVVVDALRDTFLRTSDNRAFHLTRPTVATRPLASRRSRFATVTQCIRDVAKSIRGGDTDVYEARDLAEWMNENQPGGTRSGKINRFLAALADEHGQENPLDMLDCGHWVANNDDDNEVRHEHRGYSFCQSCLDRERFVWCDDTDDYRQRGHAYYSDEDECWYGNPPDDDDDEDDEDDEGSPHLQSWNATTRYLTHDTSFTPSQFGDFTMGIELEVQAQRSSERPARISECHEYFNESNPALPGYAMFKRDGSLNEYTGFEIVTAARRLEDHVKMFRGWKPSDLTSWDNGHCGMHVHIDSRAFSALTLGKFLMFFNDNKNADFIRDIAGRHPHHDDQAERYAAALDQELVVNPKMVKDRSSNSSRYRMVNVTNLQEEEQQRLDCRIERDSKGSYSTVEVRIFRGTLRKSRLLAQIEFANAAVHFCRTASWQDLSGAAFKAWLGPKAGVYPSLARWLGVSRVRNKNYGAETVRRDAVAEV